MKYCTKCGKELYDEAVICMGCGCMVENNTNNANSVGCIDRGVLNTLSQRVKTNAVIWMIIGAIQIVTGVFFIVGILNIVSAIDDLKYSKDLLENPIGVVEKFEPITMPLIVFAYNLIFGGIVGVVGSIYYFLAIRGFVMENKSKLQDTTFC